FLALLDSLELIRFWPTLGKFWPLILVALGIWLLLRKTYFSLSEVSSIKEGKKYSKAFGDLRIDANGMDPHGLDAEMGFGDLDLNLTKANFSDRENIINLALGFGDIKVWVPGEVKLSATGTCGAGEVDILGKHADGLGNRINYQDESYEAAQKRLKIIAKLGFGDIRISRV
ncbi:MAG: cell wall-active antibiotics response protein LiaF, partial [Candidatus Zixiibacteriota bacterium]